MNEDEVATGHGSSPCKLRAWIGPTVAVSLGVLGCGFTAVPSARSGSEPSRSDSMRASVDLSGPWWFRRAPEQGGAALDNPGANVAEWMPATVPGCVHTDLLANGKIGDPFYGENEKDLQWIDTADWEYRKSFVVDGELFSRQRLELTWKGLDTYASVSLNGTDVLEADNMFREWRVDVKSLIRQGENTIVVRLRSPTTEGKAAYDRLGHALPASNDQGNPMVSMFTRKAPYQYGWDWGPRFVTSGIWRPVLLEAWDDAMIGDLHVVQEELSDQRARLAVKATVVAAHPGQAVVALTVDGGAPLAQARAALATGSNLLEAHVVIDHPERWWPNGLGKPRLYEIRASLSVDGARRDARAVRVGLRTLEVVHKDDKDGKSFIIHVNGAPVFMKGANYIPQDSFPSRVSSEKYRWLLQSAADAHMNMLRVWGGGIYEDDRFYDLCDELGILVWQDFMFACSMYPGDERFVESVRREAIDNVTRLRNHPSLALWAGNNEVEGAWKKWGWQQKFQLSETAQADIWNAYERIFHQALPKVVAEYDPGRFYTRSSPSANDEHIQPDTIGYGDMHYWGVWHAEKPYSMYADNISRFMSEYGFQSFPDLATVARYAGPGDRKIESPVMLAHQRHPRGNQLIRTYMDRDFRAPKDFASFLYVSQVLQATVIQFAAEAHRRRWPYNAGSLYWQLDDCWPVTSWSSIDYFGRWKALHYVARRFFAPVLVSTVGERGIIGVWVTSDRRVPTQLRLRLRLIDLGGPVLWEKTSDILVEGNTSKGYVSLTEGEALAGADPDRAVLVAEAVEGDATLSRSVHYFVKTKDLDLPDPELKVEVGPGRNGESVVRVSAKKLARAVRLNADAEKGVFSDNYFDLLPGESILVDWTGPANASITASSIRDTYQ